MQSFFEDDCSSSESGCGDEEYVVEKIEKRRVLENGQVEYFLKWKNWSSQYNSWEPEEHLRNCPELVEQFLNKEKNKELIMRTMDQNNNRKKKNKKVKMSLKIPDVCGFDKGWEAEKILGATEYNGLTFLVKFKGIDKTELVPSRIARYRCPSLVISFFEKHITWHSSSEKKKKF